MTEYDYSPEAWEKYLASQDRIARWVDGTKGVQPCNAFTPATPHVQALALKEKERREKEEERRSRRTDDSEDSDSDYYEPQRQHARRSQRHRSHHTRPRAAEDDYVIVEKPMQRKGPPNLTLHLTPFPTTPQNPYSYSYRNSGDSSHSSNTTTPVTPTHPNGMFPPHQLPVPPYSAPAVTGRAPMLGAPAKPSSNTSTAVPSKSLRSQTMPVSPVYNIPPPYPAYVMNNGQQAVMVPLRPRMKSFATYSPDPAKAPQWSPTKQPSLLKRMFTGLTSSKQSIKSTTSAGTQQQQYPQYPPPYPAYPQPQYSPQTQYPQQQQYVVYPVSPTKQKKEKGQNMVWGNKKVSRKRSISF